MRFKDKLSVLRKQHSMTQMELAEKLGISRQAISKWERGVAEPSTENLVSIGKLFNVPVDTLVDENLQLQQISSTQVAVAEKPDGLARDRKFNCRKIWVAVLSVCILLSAIASIIVIYSAAFKKPEDDSIQMEDLHGEEVDSLKVNDWSDGWTIIDDDK